MRFNQERWARDACTPPASLSLCQSTGSRTVRLANWGLTVPKRTSALSVQQSEHGSTLMRIQLIVPAAQHSNVWCWKTGLHLRDVRLHTRCYSFFKKTEIFDVMLHKFNRSCFFKFKTHVVFSQSTLSPLRVKNANEVVSSGAAGAAGRLLTGFPDPHPALGPPHPLGGGKFPPTYFKRPCTSSPATGGGSAVTFTAS